MGTYFRLTEQLAYAPASTAKDQELYTAVDVERFDILDLIITASFEAPAGPNLTVGLISGCQCASTDGWVSVGSFPLVSSSAPQLLKLPGGYFRYLRWSITSNGLSGATAARFMIEGVGRSYTGT